MNAFRTFLFAFFLISCTSGKSAAPIKRTSPVEILPVRLSPAHFVDSLLLANTAGESFRFDSDSCELNMGNLFEKGRKHAVITSYVNDTLLEIRVLELRQAKWDTIVLEQVKWYEDIMPIGKKIGFGHFDKDKVQDLLITTTKWDTGESGELWLYARGTFVRMEGFAELTNPRYDEQRDELVCYEAGGCADLDMDFKTYQLTGNRVVLKSDINCNCCELEETGSCEIWNRLTDQKTIVPAKSAGSHVPALYRELVRSKVN